MCERERERVDVCMHIPSVCMLVADDSDAERREREHILDLGT